MVPTYIWMSIPIQRFIDQVDRSRWISTVDTESPKVEYGRYWRSTRIYLRRFTVDGGLKSELILSCNFAGNFVVDFIDDTFEPVKCSKIFERCSSSSIVNQYSNLYFSSLLQSFFFVPHTWDAPEHARFFECTSHLHSLTPSLSYLLARSRSPSLSQKGNVLDDWSQFAWLGRGMHVWVRDFAASKHHVCGKHHVCAIGMMKRTSIWILGAWCVVHKFPCVIELFVTLCRSNANRRECRQIYFGVLYRVTQEGVLNRSETDMTWIRCHALLCLHALLLACKCLRVISLSVFRSPLYVGAFVAAIDTNYKKTEFMEVMGRNWIVSCSEACHFCAPVSFCRCIVTCPYCHSWFNSADM